ncbi:ABC transporter permease [Streptomyces sp. NPDC058086]|uniref:ABC transporter permease n=1 Tax=Streptomyces sp. NPDC058086 TaxID=3346334 RepID=UPI0036EB960E
MHDIWLIFCRELSHRLRHPVWVIMGLVQPVLYMFFFGPLVQKFVAHTPGFPPGGIWTIFAPALMVQMVIIGSTFVGVNLLVEYRAGVLERFRVTPASPVALLLGKVLTVATTVLIQSCLIVLVCHLAFGLNPSLAGMSLCLLIVGLLSMSLASCSYAIALRVKNEDGVQALLNALVLPLFLLSGTLLPITAELAPGWLWYLSRINPVAYVMDAGRASFRGDFAAAALPSGLIALAVMTTISLWWGVWTFSRENN